MATTYEANSNYPGVFTVTAQGGESSAPVEIRGFSNVSVSVRRVSGATETGSIQVSNDGENWFVAHSKEWATTTGDGGNIELSGMGASTQDLHDILQHARYARLTVTGVSTDVVEAVFNCTH